VSTSNSVRQAWERLAAGIRFVIPLGRHRRRIAYPRPNRIGFRRWVPSWRQVLGLFVMSIMGLAATVAIAYGRAEIPETVNAVAQQQNNVYYWADGTEMARTGLVDRQVMPLDQVPEQVQWAILAAENETFYTDFGVSPKGMGRALWNMARGGDTQGGSTITQQYVKNVYLDQDQTVSRKFSEVLISLKLDNRISKQQILQGYLNTSWFGRGTYGIQRAARAYYGKDVSQLNVSQGAFLASLLKGAGLFDPALSPANHRRAVERWGWILDRMVKIGKLTPAERARYKTFPEPITTTASAGLGGQTGYLVDTARTYVTAHTDITDAQFDRGGFQIRTTFQKPAVTALNTAVRSTLKQALRPNERLADQHVRVGAASVAPDGRIVALYGGRDYLLQGFNDANSFTIPAGSAFTPFVYAAALRDGVQKQRDVPRTPVTPLTVYDGNNRLPVMTPEGPYWDRSGKIVRAENDAERSWGPVSLLQAVEDSVNTPIMQLGMDVGLDRVRRAAMDAGLLESSLAAPVPGFSLGTSYPSAIRMADAYATFAAQGVHSEPYSVMTVIHNGTPVDMPAAARRRAFSPAVAGEVMDALRGAARQGTAAPAGAVIPGSAGKTGTSVDHKSAWYIGTTERMSTAVSLFRIDPKKQTVLPLDGVGGTHSTTPGKAVPMTIWARYTKALTTSKAARP
jgi:membrane peptidoglycan carboxypeptidase